ncbi:hypothetical protein L7F22_036791 [Adiantum nelumboides]|nr:hypothetical protein [Adiantum nelumboides]
MMKMPCENEQGNVVGHHLVPVMYPCISQGGVTLDRVTMVPFGISSENNYLVRVADEKSNYIVGRPRPRLNFATPPDGLQDTDIILKDASDFNVKNKLPSLNWEGLQNEIGFPTELKRFFGDKIVLEKVSDLQAVKNDSGMSASKHKGQPDLSLQNLFIQAPEEDIQPYQQVVQADDGKIEIIQSDAEDVALSEKPQLQGAIISKVNLTPKLQKVIRKRVFPREEPWLMESMILSEKTDTLKPEAANVGETGHEVAVNEGQDTMEKVAEKKAEKQIEILINSSKCTMEWIAILENGKLVELLLEPLNSDINVGNVYLGIVKKLLPGMTGVFVDIGHPRVALLSITKNVYPFTYPPIVSSSCADDPIYAKGEKQGIASVEPGQPDLKGNGVMEEDWETENEDDEEDEDLESTLDMEDLTDSGSHSDASHGDEVDEKRTGRKLLLKSEKGTRPITVNFGQRFTKWRKVEEGMRIIVQVKREPLGKKGPKVCAFPQLSSRFWVLGLGGKSTGVSKKINGPERKRLKDIANLLQKPGLDLTVRTEAAGQSQEDLERDLARLLVTWKDITEQAESASIAAQNGQDGAVPALLHRAMGQTLSIVRDFFAEKVHRMVVDSAQTYHEIVLHTYVVEITQANSLYSLTSPGNEISYTLIEKVTCYLQEVAPQLQNRVELYTGTVPILDVFNLEADIDKILNERAQQPALRGLLMPVSDEPDLIDQEYEDDTSLFLHYTLMF